MSAMKLFMFRSGMAALTGALLMIQVGCTTAPVSGRRQLNFIGDQQAAQLGLDAFQQMKTEVPISQDPAANALVERVGKRIAAVAADDLPDAEWEFVVFESDQANAFCLPGGKVGVYTGILSITQDEAGLATVIGHEVAHASARHGAERMSEAMAMQGIGEILGVTMSGNDPKLQSATMIAYNLGAQFGRALPHGRKQESEADYVGLIYMAQAGYDPRASVGFWKRFGAATGSGQPPAFFSTHPPSQQRIEDLQKAMPEAMAIFEQSRIGQ